MLSLFLGCDYTDGVKGVGIVNGMEILAAYKDFDSLIESEGLKPGQKDQIYETILNFMRMPKVSNLLSIALSPRKLPRGI